MVEHQELAKVKTQAKSSSVGKQRSGKLILSLIYYYSKLKYACYTELGIRRWGASRVDFIAINQRLEVIGVEVKQSIQDFRQDNKYHHYLPYANKFYFCFPYDLWEKHKDELNVEAGCGILVLQKSGRIKVMKKATLRKVEPEHFNHVISKMLWRGGISARYTKSYKVIL